MARIVLHKELFDHDKELRREYPVICGVDEAGRGPLAGDVYTAAVVLNDEVLIDYLNDSKKISESRREKLFDEITEKADAYCIATASVAEIDELNILQATMLAMKRAVEGLGITPDLALVDGNRMPAMKRAVEGLGITPDLALVDGNRMPDLSCPARCVIKGDATSASIAAASVLAKVSRDRYMKQIAEKYPQYCFEQHKGYGTKLHCEMLKKYGASDIHRRSFLKKILGDDNEQR